MNICFEILSRAFDTFTKLDDSMAHTIKSPSLVIFTDRSFFFLVSRAHEMHSRHKSGVAADQSSCGFINCSGMETETNRCAE